MLTTTISILQQTNPWILLISAVVCSAMGTTSLKFLSKKGGWLFFLLMIIGYSAFLFLITMVLKQIEMGIGYAVWSGLSTALMCVSGVVFFNEPMNIRKVVSITLIIVGIVGLNIANFM